MNTPNTLRKALGIGALVVALSGCDQTPSTHGEAYKQQTTTKQATTTSAPSSEESASLYGKIVDVQPGIVSIARVPISDSSASLVRQFEYVQVQGEYGKLHVLIYPTPKAIAKGGATFTYRPLNGGISADQFIDDYVSPDFGTNDNIFLEADGIIKVNGIQYETIER